MILYATAIISLHKDGVFAHYRVLKNFDNLPWRINVVPIHSSLGLLQFLLSEKFIEPLKVDMTFNLDDEFNKAKNENI
jgi:hypothetical protein